MSAETTTSTLLPFNEELTELALLVPSWQAAALEDAANREGMTLAQYLRRLLTVALRPSTCWQ